MNIQPTLFITLFCSFILFTVVGTLSHETGHLLVAEYFGYEAHINYGSTTWGNEEEMNFLQNTHADYREQMLAGQDYPGKEKYQALVTKILADSFWIALGGPVQTMLTGTIGLLLLVLSYHKIRQLPKLTFKYWLYVFITLFWLRQVANLVVGTGIFLLKGRFPQYGDEAELANDLGLPFWSIQCFTAAIGLGIFSFVFFKIIPVRERFTFLSAGFLGGIAGYVLWLEMLGPVMMP